MRLVPIQRGGILAEHIPPLPVGARDILEAADARYDAVGFDPPWIGYIAVANELPVGACGFKSAPRGGRVEIAYFTFPGYEGSGVGTQMARTLISIARDASADVLLVAQTLPARNPSHRVLEKLGFTCVGAVEHPDDGSVLEWHKAAPAGSNRSARM
jgi:[ribosomal protein S5]-alanine N-acetyltransferase